MYNFNASMFMVNHAMMYILRGFGGHGEIVGKKEKPHFLISLNVSTGMLRLCVYCKNNLV